MNIIGISAFYHDSACCLLKEGRLIAAAQEERFSRIKHDSLLPVQSFKYCLKEGNLTINDIDYIAYYENPEKKLARQLWSGVDYFDPKFLNQLNPHRPETSIRRILGYEGPIRFFDHHLSHAASSFYYSGFHEAATFTVDGVGEWATTSYGYGKGEDLQLFEEVSFPNSIGLLYSSITNYLGFSVNSGEYKVMGLAPYGKPLYKRQLYKLIKIRNRGQFELNLDYFDFIKGKQMFSDKLIDLLGNPARKKESDILQVHKDIASSLQVVLEEVLMEKVKFLFSKYPSENLCMAGGVALNCVANGKILRNGPYKKLFVQPAANDAGNCLGAAALCYTKVMEGGSKIIPLSNVFLGPDYQYQEIEDLLNATDLKFETYKLDDLLKETVSRISKGQVIGWFQGRMEFGPRALGNRSILADPRLADMRDRINAMVKKREGFRPFAPAIMEEEAKYHFDLPYASPFMLETCKVISQLDLPAITHVDSSARVQTVNKEDNYKFYRLLNEFKKVTGCPILLNTSFNVRGEPIVCSPLDALLCFIKTDIDCLVLGDIIIDRKENSLELDYLLSNLPQHKTSVKATHDVYSFI